MPEKRTVSYRTISKQLCKEIRTNDSQNHTEDICICSVKQATHRRKTFGTEGATRAKALRPLEDQCIFGRPVCWMQSENEEQCEIRPERKAMARS